MSQDEHMSIDDQNQNSSTEEEADEQTPCSSSSSSRKQIPLKAKMPSMIQTLKMIYDIHSMRKSLTSVIIAVHNIGLSSKIGLKHLHEEIFDGRIDVFGVVDPPQSSHIATLRTVLNLPHQELRETHISGEMLQAVQFFGFGNTYSASLVSHRLQNRTIIMIRTSDVYENYVAEIREDIACGLSVISFQYEGTDIGMLTFYAAPRLFSARATGENKKDFIDFNHWVQVFKCALRILMTRYKHVILCGDANCGGAGWANEGERPSRLSVVIEELVELYDLSSPHVNVPPAYAYSFINVGQKESVVRATARLLELQRCPGRNVAEIKDLEVYLGANTAYVDLMFYTKTLECVRKIPIFTKNAQYVPDHTVNGFEFKIK